MLHFRNIEAVLKEDVLKLKQMQKFQPKFTEDHKKELFDVHPWIQKGGLPEAIDNSVRLKDCFSLNIQLNIYLLVMV